MADTNRSVPGQIMVTVGVLIFAFVLLANMIGVRPNPVLRFLEAYLIIPIVMIFAGRAMIRRARRDSPPPVEWPPQREEPAPRQPAQPRQQQTPRPAPPLNLESPDMDDIVVAARATRQARVAETTPGVMPQPKVSDMVPKQAGKGDKPKSSDEMIADAKKRLGIGTGQTSTVQYGRQDYRPKPKDPRS